MSPRSTRSDPSIAQWRLDAFPGATPAGGWIAPLLEEVAAVQQAVARGAWSEALPQSTRCLGFGYAALRWIEGEVMAERRRREMLRRRHRALSELLKALARSDGAERFFTRLGSQVRPRDRDERVEAAVQALRREISQRDLPDAAFDELRRRLAKHASDAPNVNESLEMMAEGKTSGVPLLDALDGLGEAPSGRVAQQAAIACLSRGLMAWVHSEFNLALRTSRADAEVDALTRADAREAIAMRVDDFAAQLRAGQLGLYGALAADRPTGEVILLASALAGGIEARLPAFAHVQAKLHSAIGRLRAQRKGGASETLGRLAVRAGMLTREALATHAASYRIAAELSSDSPHAEVAALRKQAPSIPFEAKLPVGTRVELAKLDSVEDAASVEIEGFVQTLEATRTRDRKLVTRIELLDPSSRARAHAVVLFVDLPHAGVTIDAYCRLHGTFRRTSKLFDAGPVVEVDRLSLTKLKARSWWVGFLQLADPWAPYWRNNTSMYWSLGPHEGFEAGETARHGAAEIVFLPAIRSPKGGD